MNRLHSQGAMVISLPVSDATPQRLIEAGVSDANRVWRVGRERYIENVLEIARHVYDVWQDCERHKKSFRSLFDAKAKVKFDFSRRHAQMFLAIAKNPALMGGEHARQSLPLDITTLAKLAQIQAPKLTSLIKDGTVTTDMKRTEAAALVGTNPKRKTAPINTSSNSAYENAYEKLRKLLLAMPTKQRQQELISLVNDCGLTEILK